MHDDLIEEPTENHVNGKTLATTKKRAYAEAANARRRDMTHHTLTYFLLIAQSVLELIQSIHSLLELLIL